LVEETGIPGENHDQPHVSDTLYHISGIRTHNCSGDRASM